jgi:multiple sugar transport system substrate-binding protein
VGGLHAGRVGGDQEARRTVQRLAPHHHGHTAVLRQQRLRVDNLALVYNKKLFAQAGIAPPTASWTWSDFENAALKLTDPSKKQFGWAYVNDASEDTAWRFWAMLWQAGGQILSADNKQAAFNSPAGVKALTLLQQLVARKAIYLDNGSDNYLPVFNAGHIGMLWTGPWDLQQIAESKVSYGVQILPAAENHQTISGPDDWVMFNNGSARVAASWTFLKWLTSPQDRPRVGFDDR